MSVYKVHQISIENNKLTASTAIALQFSLRRTDFLQTCTDRLLSQNASMIVNISMYVMNASNPSPWSFHQSLGLAMALI